MKYKYLVVFEREGASHGAFVPDLPGCVAVAKTRAKVRQLIHEAIELHSEDMIARGQRPPAPMANSDYVEAQLAS